MGFTLFLATTGVVVLLSPPKIYFLDNLPALSKVLYCTTWHKVLNEHFPESLEEALTYSCNEKEDFERAIEF